MRYKTRALGKSVDVERVVIANGTLCWLHNIGETYIGTIFFRPENEHGTYRIESYLPDFTHEAYDLYLDALDALVNLYDANERSGGSVFD